MTLQIVIKKRAEKYLLKVPNHVRERLQQGIEDIANGNGDIVRLQDNRYRYKVHHYRILFTLYKDEQIIEITEINTRTNIKY